MHAGALGVHMCTQSCTWFPDNPGHNSYPIHFKFGIKFESASGKKTIDFGACRCTGDAPVHPKVHPGFQTISDRNSYPIHFKFGI